MKTTHPLQILVLSCLLLTSGLTFQAQAAASGGKTAPAPRCLVAEVRGIAFTIHHPNDRYLAITEWLNKNGAACSLEKLQYINSNRPNWFGHSDSPALGQVLDQLIEIATGEPPKQATPPDNDRSSLLAGTSREDAPAPVVAPAGTGQPPIVVAPVLATPGGPGGKAPGAGARP